MEEMEARGHPFSWTLFLWEGYGIASLLSDRREVWQSSEPPYSWATTEHVFQNPDAARAHLNGSLA